MANDPTSNGAHDVQSKHSSLTEMNSDESKTHLQSVINTNSSDINHDDHKKAIDQTSKTDTTDQPNTSLSVTTSEPTAPSTAQTDATSSKIHPHNKPLKRSVPDQSQHEDNDHNNRQRTGSSSSSTSSSSSGDNQTSNIPYEILDNDDDDDDDDDLPEPPKEPANPNSHETNF